MTVNYTTNLALGQPVTGTESGTWGDDVNNSVTSYLDIAIAGGLSVTVTTADVTLTLTQGTSSATNIGSTTAQYAILNVSGAMTAARNLILPSSSRQYVINNNTTGGFALTVKGSATSGVTMVNGEKAHVFWNGSDYAKLSNTPGGAGTFSSITNTGLTSGRVVYSTTGGLETDSANLTFSGTDLTVYGLTVGRGAGADASNTAVGASALAANTTGTQSTATGNSALIANTTGIRNSAFGFNALLNSTTGDRNTAIGRASLYALLSGSDNTAVGANALFSYNSGSFNTAVGSSALNGASSTGSNNTAVGYQAGYANTTGAGLTFVGSGTGFANTTGTDNVAVGSGNSNGFTFYTNTFGSFNSVFGGAALRFNTTGSYNTAIGQGALLSNTTASNNTAVGYQAGYSNTGADNTFLGHVTGYYVTSGAANVYIGRAAGANVAASTGSNNVGIGYTALYAITSGSNNTAVGYQAGTSITTGPTNICIGYLSGAVLTTGNNNLYLGASTTASSSNIAQEMVISTKSSAATGKGNNTGFIEPNGGGVYQGNNSTLWSVTSDQRLKKNIVDNNTGLDIINQIQVRNFEYRLPEEITDVPQDQAIAKTGVQLGVIAQELQQILPECVKTESTGVMTVDADNLTWYLINAVKELTARVAQLETKGT